MAKQRIFLITTFKSWWLFDPTGKHEETSLPTGTHRFVLETNPLNPTQKWLTLEGSTPPTGTSYRAWAEIYSQATNENKVIIEEVF